jgi:tRNA(Ile2) C34 agmatinyltransferase TiaS
MKVYTVVAVYDKYEKGGGWQMDRYLPPLINTFGPYSNIVDAYKAVNELIEKSGLTVVWDRAFEKVAIDDNEKTTERAFFQISPTDLAINSLLLDEVKRLRERNAALREHLIGTYMDGGLSEDEAIRAVGKEKDNICPNCGEEYFIEDWGCKKCAFAAQEKEA